MTQREITKRQPAEDQLPESDRKYRQLHESMMDGFARVDMQGRFIDWNDAFCRIVGYEPQQLLKLTYTDLTLAKGQAFEADMVARQVMVRGHSDVYEKEYRRRDGTIVPVELRVHLVRDAAGNASEMWAIVRDISDRKRAERALQEYEKVVENSTDVMIVVDREYRHVLANGALLEMTGLTREQVIGRTIAEAVGEEFFQRVPKPRLDECFAGRVVEFESEFDSPRHGIRNLLVSLYPVSGSEVIDHVCCVMHDITERKRAEQVLQEYEKAVESSPNMIAVVDREHRYLIANPPYLEHVGRKREQVIGHRVSEVLGQEDFDRAVKKRLDEGFAGKVVRFERQGLTATKGERILSAAYFPIEGVTGIDRVCCVFQDVTERRMAEAEIRESRNKYEALIASTSDFIWEVDALGRYTYCSPQMEKLWGLKPEAMIGRTPFEVMPAKQSATAEEIMAALVKSPRPFSQLELESFDVHGNLIYIEASGVPFFDHDGRLLGYRGLTRDVTERRKAETEIAEQLRFETLVNELSSRLVHATPEQMDHEINHALRRVCESLNLEMGTLWTSSTAPDAALTHAYVLPGAAPPAAQHLNGPELFPWCFGKLAAGETVSVSSLQELPPEAALDRENWRQFGIKSTLSFALALGGNVIAGALSFNTLQAERFWPAPLIKRLELLAQMFSNALARQKGDRALRASEERFRSLVENATVGIYRTTPDGRILAANPTLITMLGYVDFESLAARNLEHEGFEPTYSRKEFRERMEKEGQVIGLEAAWRKSEGSVIFVRESARAIRGDEGTVLHYDGIVEDITERKRAAEALQESQRQLSLVYRTVSDIIFQVGVESGDRYRFLSVNPAFLNATGLTAEQVLGKLVQEVIPEPSLTMVLGKYAEAIEGKNTVRWEEKSEYPAGTKVGEVAVAPVFDDSGRCRYLVGSVHDVTDHRRKEEALRRQAEFNEMMTQVLNRFATCGPSEVDAAVDKALEAIAKFIGADHAIVVQSPPRRMYWRLTHEWCGPKVTPRMPELEGVPMGTLPWNEQRLLAGEIIRINTPDDYPLVAVAERSRQKEEGSLSDLTIPIRTENGIYKCIGLHSHARPVTWTDDDVARLRLVGDALANALERKQALEELQKSEEKFSKAFHASPVTMTIVSVATGRYLDVNRAFEERTGFRAQEVIGRMPEEFGKPGVGREQFRGLEVQYRTKSGEPRTILLYSELIEFGGGACSLRVEEDITERKRVEQSLREIGARLLMAQEAERRRVARELHDDYSQRLALLAIDLEQLTLRSPERKSEWRARTQAILSRTRDLSNDVHRLSYELHPSKLEHLGLVAAVRGYCSELSRQAGIEVNFSDARVPVDLPKEISLCIYRTVQEALGNVVKHSGAKTAAVDLRGGADEVCLTVSDPGKGFSVEDTQASQGLGLVGMQERVRYVGGSRSIDTRPGEGTRVIVRIPVSSPQAAEAPCEPSAGVFTSPSEQGRRVRVLLADDHTLLLEAFKGLLEPEFEVVGTAADGHAALVAIENLKPDVVVLDIAMPLLNGLEVARRTHRLAPDLKVIFLTMNPDPEVAREAMQIGASGYLLKTSASSELRKAIRGAVRGVKYISRRIQEQEKLFIDEPRAGGQSAS